MFTSLLLADLVERGEVTLDTPVAKLLPAKVKVPERNQRFRIHEKRWCEVAAGARVFGIRDGEANGWGRARREKREFMGLEAHCVAPEVGIKRWRESGRDKSAAKKIQGERERLTPA